MSAHSSILAWRMRMDRGAWRATVPGAAVSRTWPSDSAEAHHVLCRMESSTAAQLVTARLTHRPKQELFLFYLPYILHAFILYLFHAEITLVLYFLSFNKGLSGGTVTKNPHANAGDTRDKGSVPGLIRRKIPWRRKWQHSPAFWPRKSHGQRSLVGYIVHGVTKSQTWLSDWACAHTHTHRASINGS